MRTRNIYATCVVALSLIGADVSAAENYTQPVLKPDVRFQGEVVVGPDLKTGEKMNVGIKNWSINGKRKIERLPIEGDVIVHLRSGEVTTVINGKRQKRTEDEFWTVPAGTQMGIETEDDTAVLQTINLDRR